MDREYHRHVSIHAPTRGATQERKLLQTILVELLCTGADEYDKTAIKRMVKFILDGWVE